MANKKEEEKIYSSAAVKTVKPDEVQSATNVPPMYIPQTYKPSTAVTDANEALRKNGVQSPGQYQSKWDAKLGETMDKILNRQEFSYDVNGDALYKQYADKFTRQGKTAMEDTIARASAMTGGFGNSYAQTAGQAAFAGEMQKLGDVIPELYQLALDKYTREGETLRENAAMLAEMDERDYGRHRDKVDDWRTERDYLTERADTEYNRDYGKWSDKQEGYKDSFDVTNDNWWTLRDEAREDAATAAEIKAKQGDFSGYAELYGVDDAVAREMWEKEQSSEAYATLAERISVAGYNPTDEELAAAGMTRGEADAYGEQYSLGMQDMRNSVYNIGSTSGGTVNNEDEGYYPYGEYTRGEFSDKMKDAAIGDDVSEGVRLVRIAGDTLDAMAEFWHCFGDEAFYKNFGARYYNAYEGIMSKGEWNKAKEEGVNSKMFTDFATYDQYYNHMKNK